jgi:hypothetical protein
VEKRPKLVAKPQLSTTNSREKWIEAGYTKNNSLSARDSRVAVVSRLAHYCLKVHGMQPEQVFNWMKKQAKTPDTLTRLAVDFLKQYVEFCKQDHKDIVISKGRGKNPDKKILNKNNYLHKLHDNSISGNVARSRRFMSQVGGIRIHDDDMIEVAMPTVIKKGQYDDEEAEPLTAEQAREVIGLTRDHRARVIYNFMNDTAFRISETGLVTDSDFDLESNPPSVKLPRLSSKGVRGNGVRYLRDSTARLVKTLLRDNPDNFTFRKTNHQTLVSFRHAELKKIKIVYRKLGMTQTYEDSGRSKYNMHSWRKRCGTEYARNNNESLSHGYLRHSKYLAQYLIKTKEERIEAFRRAEVDLAVDEANKQKIRIKRLESEKSELQQTKERNDELEQRMKEFEQQQIQMMQLIQSGKATLQGIQNSETRMKLTTKAILQ